MFTLPYDSLGGFLWTCMEFASVIERENSFLSLAFLGDEMSRVVVRILHAVVPISLPSALYSIVSAVCTEALLTITPHSHFFFSPLLHPLSFSLLTTGFVLFFFFRIFFLSCFKSYFLYTSTAWKEHVSCAGLILGRGRKQRTMLCARFVQVVF